MKLKTSPSPTTSELRTLSPDAAWRLLAFQICSMKEEKKRTKLSPQQVIEKVAKYHHLKPSQLLGRRRILHIARVRQIAMYILHQWFPSMSQNLIGAYLGNRDRTTILYGIRNVQTWMRDDWFKSQIESLESSLDEVEEIPLVDV